ncbi:branched-chain amino acid transporter AzlD [Exiguobacterium sp. KRL4]|uniref:AzlD domain-containing protein n=1 Tax=Exiguobacterium sp. KRL4 TaxID=1914536 RepID=UPI0008F956EB|nr:AzlD domain-containing protein [Exiguobacterium sp. KRL4]OIN68277.1 branched-chain amino acid transporter AzlD [Exiguobacterium sp. KRL4]
MEIRLELLVLFAACGLVTLIPRILPFLLMHGLTLPRLLTDWLSFIPICLLSALFFQNLLVAQNSDYPSLSFLHLAASIPTILIALTSKSLSFTVITGVLSMALIRFLI